MRAGYLTIGVHYEPSGVDPHIGAAELALQMTNGVFDTLVNKTVDGGYLPGLARRFEVSPDQCVYTFELRDDVLFHDGEPCDAAAVKFSLDRARDPANRSQLAGGMLGPYREARVLDRYRLAIHLDRPYALLLDSLSQGWLAPVSPAAVKRSGADFARHPVGSGPFVFHGWRPGRDITLRRNPAYRWAPPLVDNRAAAHLEEIRFVFLADATARTEALRRGEVDAIFYVPPQDVAPLRADPAYRIDVCPIRGIPVCLMMNTARQPTCELAVRRAINYAIDQDALVREVFRGEFPRAYGPVSQLTLGYEPVVENFYPNDPAQARRLLQDSGWIDRDGDGVREKNGVPLVLDFYALPVNFYPEFGAIIGRQLRDVGIRVEVRLVDPVPWIKAGMRGDHHLIPQGQVRQLRAAAQLSLSLAPQRSRRIRLEQAQRRAPSRLRRVAGACRAGAGHGGLRAAVPGGAAHRHGGSADRAAALQHQYRGAPRRCRRHPLRCHRRLSPVSRHRCGRRLSARPTAFTTRTHSGQESDRAAA